MNIPRAATTVTRKLLGPKVGRWVGKRCRQILPTIDQYREQLIGRRGLEIGGPSGILSNEGSVPVYDVLNSLDNCLYSARTIWTGEILEGNTFRYHPQRLPGRQIICEATSLKPVSSSSYDCLLASHCLEHVANPLLALCEWRRVLEVDGLMLLLLPHKDGTFNRRRAPTTLSHMIADFENGTEEDDLTHLPEILELHDLSRDVAAGTAEQFRRRCMENSANRAMHHHVFDTLTALQVVDYAGFKIIQVDNLNPYHIIILASHAAGTVDNRPFFEKGSEHWRRSPFASDWAVSGREIMKVAAR